MANDHSTGNARPNETYSPKARKRLAENVRVLRLMHGWSQDALAKAAKLDRSYVGRIERGERNIGLDSLERLALAFWLTVPEILQPIEAQTVGERLLTKLRSL